MSRAGATKGGKEKPKPPASQTPVTATEIVPGKFNESDWNAMVERDNAEDFVHDIVDEILSKMTSDIYKLYLDKQLLPFTITQAKDAILQIIEWQFLARDDGEQGCEPSWVQDEEPDAAVTDCWAQGSVPKKAAPKPPTIVEEDEEVEQEVVEAVQKEEEKEDAEEPEMEDKVSEGEAPEEAELQAAEQAAAAAEAKKKAEEEKEKKKRKFKPYRGKLKSAGVSRMTESLEETEMQMYMTEMAETMTPQQISSNLLTMPASCHSILRVQNGRPPGNKEVEFDEMGNVVSVMKLDTDKLPNHRVNVKFRVVDPSVEASQARLEAMRRGCYMAPTEKQLGKTVKNKKSSADSTVTGKTSMKSVKRKPQITTLPPTLLETMEISPGVTVMEAGRSKKGPGRQIRRGDILNKQRDLQPVTIKIKTNAITVSDLLDRNTPILRPMDDSMPLPPIVPTPPSGTPMST